MSANAFANISYTSQLTCGITYIFFTLSLSHPISYTVQCTHVLVATFNVEDIWALSFYCSIYSYTTSPLEFSRQFHKSGSGRIRLICRDPDAILDPASFCEIRFLFKCLKQRYFVQPVKCCLKLDKWRSSNLNLSWIFYSDTKENSIAEHFPKYSVPLHLQ